MSRWLDKEAIVGLAKQVNRGISRSTAMLRCAEMLTESPIGRRVGRRLGRFRMWSDRTACRGNSADTTRMDGAETWHCEQRALPAQVPVCLQPPQDQAPANRGSRRRDCQRLLLALRHGQSALRAPTRPCGAGIAHTTTRARTLAQRRHNQRDAKASTRSSCRQGNETDTNEGERERKINENIEEPGENIDR